MNKITLYFIILNLFTLSLFAQNVEIIQGQLLDKQTNEPIPFANIYVNNTTIGTQSNENGEFSLKLQSVQNSKLIFSSIGYKTLERNISIGKNIIYLEPDNTQLSEVKVASKKDKKWNSNYKVFEKAFLGNTEAAKYCKIIRPWEIDFENTDRGLIAKASNPIEIENNYLGYKVFWYLKSFVTNNTDFSLTGNARFEYLKAKNKNDIKVWSENRKEVFKGSLQHFLSSLYYGTTEAEGYKIYQESTTGKGKSRYDNFSNELNVKKTVENVNATNLIICQNNICFINLKNQIEVHYSRKSENKPAYSDIPYQVSWLEGAENMVAFDSLGFLKKPQNIAISGSMNASRVAELLPINYKFNDFGNKEYNKSYWQERVFLNTNKAFYHPKERMWIKANMIYENQLYRDSLSKILYVDFIGPKKNIILSQKWEIFNGEANGDILLPDSVQMGEYYLRAYTNYMRNFGDSTFFHKKIYILKQNQRLSTKNVETILNENNIISIENEEVKGTDSLQITIKGMPFRNYAVSIIDKHSVEKDQVFLPNFKVKKNENLLYPIEKSISLNGYTNNKKGKAVFSKISMVDIKNNNFKELETDRNGNFQLNNLWAQDTIKLFLKATDKKGKKLRKIKIFETEKPKINLLNFPVSEIVNLTENEAIDNDFMKTADATMLENVTVKARKEDLETADRSNKLYGKANFVVKASEIQSKVSDENLITFLRGRVPGLQIDALTDNSNIGKKNYRVRIRGRAGFVEEKNPLGGLSQTYEPLVLLDGVPYPSIEILESMSISQIDRIEVINRIEVLYGARGANGIIAIYSLNQAKIQQAMPDLTKLIDYEQINVLAFSLPKEFSQKNKNGATLLWQPSLVTDEVGNAKMMIRKTKGNWVIKIVGFDNKNNLVQAEKLLELN